MLLSVLCIVFVIAAIVAAAIYFGVYDPNDHPDSSVNKVINGISDTGKDWADKIKN